MSAGWRWQYSHVRRLTSVRLVEFGDHLLNRLAHIGADVFGEPAVLEYEHAFLGQTTQCAQVGAASMAASIGLLPRASLRV